MPSTSRRIRTAPAPTLAALPLAVLLLAAGPSGAAAQEVGVSEPFPAAAETAAESAATAAAEAPGAPGEAEQTEEAEDPELAARIRAAFRNVDAFDAVMVEAVDGVVRLSGTVPEPGDAADAAELASRFAGVLWVDNRVRPARDVPGRLAPAWENLREYGHGLVAALPTLLIALLVGLAFGFLARAVARWERPVRWLRLGPLAGGLVRRLAGAAVLVAGAVLALDILGITALVGAVLGTAGIAGIVLGFAFQKIVESYLAGILLSARRLFEVNDLVEIGGQLGRVIRLTASDLVLMTPDGNHLRLPNSAVFQGTVLNYTRNPRRRFSFTVGVGTGVDLAAAARIGRETLAGMQGVVADPRPQVLVEALGDSSVTLRASGWVDQREADFAKVRSEAIRLLKQAYDEAGIDMPEPAWRVRLDPGAGGPAEAQPRARAPEGQPADTAPDRPIERQVAEDLAGSRESNLLEPPGP